MQPRVLVLDEPLSDLDPVGAQEVLGHAAAAGPPTGGTGVVIIEHRVDEVAPWADRVVLMDDGRVRLDRPPRQAWADQAPGWPSASASRTWSGWRTRARRVPWPARRCRWTRRSRRPAETWLAPR